MKKFITGVAGFLGRHLAENFIRLKGTKEFSYYLDIEINNENTPETWTKKQF